MSFPNQSTLRVCGMLQSMLQDDNDLLDSFFNDSLDLEEEMLRVFTEDELVGVDFSWISTFLYADLYMHYQNTLAIEEQEDEEEEDE